MSLARRCAARTGFGLGAALFAACPPHQVEIDISPAGAATIIGTCGSGLDELLDADRRCNDIIAECEQIDDPCVRDGCDKLLEICTDLAELDLETQRCSEFASICARAVSDCGTIEQALCDDLVAECEDVANVLKTVCVQPGLARPDFSQPEVGLGVRVVLVTQVGGALMASSPCGQVKVACGGAPSAECVAAALDEGIAAAIGDEGLGYGGLETADQTLPMVLAFRDDGGEGCQPEQLFACAALARLVPSAESYDVVCGWCQEGSKPSLPTAPCQDTCQLGYCVDIAAQAGG
jgi:hypothetical protein